MFLNDLLDKFGKREFVDRYRRLYPFTTDQVIRNIAEVFEELEFLEPAESDIDICIATFTSSSDDKVEYLVNGIGKAGFEYPIEYVDWSIWLGSECHVDISVCSELDFCVHCVREMTFFGFSNSEVQLKVKKMKLESEI